MRVIPTREKLKEMFMDVPGHKRSGTITVASTAPPAVAPRMTRAAALRLGLPPPESPSKARRASMDVLANANKEKDNQMFEGVPGHKRRESIQVASTKAPTMAPRLNKSAALRVQKDAERGAPPPSSYMCTWPFSISLLSVFRTKIRTSWFLKTAVREHSSRSLSRSTSNSELGTSRPASAQSQVRSTPSLSASVSRRPPSRTASASAPLSQSVSSPRVSTSKSEKPPSKTANSNGSESPASPAPAKPRPRPSSLQAPAMAPRQNKSAMLRAAKMAAQQNGGKPVKV